MFRQITTMGYSCIVVALSQIPVALCNRIKTDGRDALVRRIEGLLQLCSLVPVVEALRCFRGLELISAVTFVSSVGDLSRFDTPRQLMSYLGLTPSEDSSGGKDSRGRGSAFGEHHLYARTKTPPIFTDPFRQRAGLHMHPLTHLEGTKSDRSTRRYPHLCGVPRRL